MINCWGMNLSYSRRAGVPSPTPPTSRQGTPPAVQSPNGKLRNTGVKIRTFVIRLPRRITQRPPRRRSEMRRGTRGQSSPQFSICAYPLLAKSERGSRGGSPLSANSLKSIPNPFAECAGTFIPPRFLSTPMQTVRSPSRNLCPAGPSGIADLSNQVARIMEIADRSRRAIPSR